MVERPCAGSAGRLQPQAPLVFEEGRSATLVLSSPMGVTRTTGTPYGSVTTGSTSIEFVPYRRLHSSPLTRAVEGASLIALAFLLEPHRGIPGGGGWEIIVIGRSSCIAVNMPPPMKPRSE
jgi:hypothetical protein